MTYVCNVIYLCCVRRYLLTSFRKYTQLYCQIKKEVTFATLQRVVSWINNILDRKISTDPTRVTNNGSLRGQIRLLTCQQLFSISWVGAACHILGFFMEQLPSEFVLCPRLIINLYVLSHLSTLFHVCRHTSEGK